MKQKAKATVNEVAQQLLAQVPLSAIREVLGLLPGDLGEVLQLYFFEQLTVKEIAAKIHRAPATVGKKILHGCYYLEKHFETPAYRQAREILYDKLPNRIHY